MKEQTYNSFPQLMILAIGLNLTTISFGISLYCMNDALSYTVNIFSSVNLSVEMKQSILQSSVLAGCTIGCFVAIQMINIGNKAQFLISDSIVIIGSLMMYFDIFEIFVGGRFIQGLGVGLSSPQILIYLRQFAPVEIYSLLVGTNPVMLCVGILSTQLLGLMFSDEPIDEDNKFVWRVYFMMPCTVVCLLRILFNLYFIKFNTPLYYIKNNQEERAYDVLEYIYKRKYVEPTYEAIKRQISSLSNQPSLFKRPYKQRMYLAIFIKFLVQWCGSNAVLQFSTTIFRELFSLTISQGLTLAIAVTKLFTYFLSILTVHKFGKRTQFVIGNFLILVSNIAIGGSNELMSRNPGSLYLQIFSIIFIFVYLLSLFLSLGPLSIIYVPEIVPSRGVTIAGFLYQFNAFLVTFTFPYMKSYLGLGNTFFCYALVTAVGQIVLQLFFIETKNLSEDDLNRMFGKPQMTLQHPIMRESS